jgi:hypothetical protein
MAADDFPQEQFSLDDKYQMSITLRNQWESRGRKPSAKNLTISDLRHIVSQFRPLDHIEMMDHALINIDKSSPNTGGRFLLKANNDYPLYYCKVSVR